MGNRSLDEFLDDAGSASERDVPPGESSDSGGPGEIGETDETDETDESVASGQSSESDEHDAVEPAVSTYDWTPGGVACGDCGGVVETRWRDGDELVCSDCKAW